MDKREWKKIESIVDKALERSGEERTKFIDEQCKGNRELKNQVTDYLDAIEESRGYLEDEDEVQKELLINDYLDDSQTAASSLIGKVIGNYKITQLLGYGGLGSVFLAERADEEFKHEVALKILRQGMDTPKNISRFQLEREILAELSHPHIAQLYDGGVTENGLPYLVMEYVDGTPIDQYCDEHSLSISDRLSLFEDICEAVQYAHKNLIIHRDLKPGNILVSKNGEVKVLDFGISKLIKDEPETVTQKSHQMLTPAYAAPEQVSYESLTTAIDNYALGALLYKLLTGVSLFDFNHKNRTEIATIITDEIPLAPSKRLKSLAQKKQQIIANKRNSSLNKLISAIEGDLDAIILKAVRKDPSARYESPKRLMKELERYRNGEPVTARTGAFSYHLSKSVARNKVPISIASAFLLLSISFGLFYTYQISQERNQAQRQAERAEQITDFLVSILQLNTPSENEGQEITVSDALNRGIQILEQDNDTLQTLNRAVILGTIGSIQTKIGDVDEAGHTLQRAIQLVTDSLDHQTKKTLETGTQFAKWNYTVGNNDEAQKYFQMTDSLFHKNNLTNTPQFRAHQLNYSDFLLENGKYDQALSVLDKLEQSLDNLSKQTESSRDYRSDLYNSRGRAYKNMGENRKALENLDRALTIKKDIYGKNNPKIAKLYHNMGVVYGTIGEFENALDMAQKAYKIKLEVFEPTHQLVGSTLHLLGNISMELENYDQAFDYLEESVEITRKKHGANHYRYALAIREYAKALSRTNRFQEARRQIEKATSIIEKNYGIDHPYYGYMMNTYGDIHYRAKKYKQAIKYGDKTLDNFSQNFGDSHPNLGRAYANQGKYVMEMDKHQLADSLLTTAVDMLKNHFEDSNPYLQEADSLLQANTRALNTN